MYMKTPINDTEENNKSTWFFVVVDVDANVVKFNSNFFLVKSTWGIHLEKGAPYLNVFAATVSSQ